MHIFCVEIPNIGTVYYFQKLLWLSFCLCARESYLHAVYQCYQISVCGCIYILTSCCTVCIQD
jgi:hypothetical protein